MMKSHGAIHDGCGYSVVECDKGARCVPKEDCPGGRTVWRDRWTSGGHHHLEEGDVIIDEHGQSKLA